MRLRRISSVVPALAALASLTLVACGGGGGEEATTTTTSRPTTTTTTAPPPRSALTGLELSDPAIANRPVVAVKFDNVDGKSTPQVGIASADMVYEIPVEGTVTRFLALYQSQDAAPVGPVRSARGSEVGLLEELSRPLFTWHGANARLREQVRSAAIIPRAIDDIPELFYRQAGRPAPYNSFVEGTAAIRATAPDDATGPDRPILNFGTSATLTPSPLAVPASSIAISFPPFGSRSTSTVAARFAWDGSRWLRSQNGHAHVDGDGRQIAVDNVIIRFTQAVDSGTTDAAGSRVPTAVVTGEGEAWVFSGNTVTKGTWRKPDNLSTTRYFDSAGQEITLRPGVTWIALPYGLGSSSYS